jgi:hypothetical protein
MIYELLLTVVAFNLLLLYNIRSVRWYWWIRAANVVGLAFFVNCDINLLVRGMPISGGFGLLCCYALAILLALDICQELDNREGR